MGGAVLSAGTDGSTVAAGTLCLAVTSSTSIVGVAIGPAGSPAEGAVLHGGVHDKVAHNEVAHGGVVHNEVVTDRRHAEELTPLLVRTLAEAGVTLEDIGCFVVDVGPGRFTGLRVGLATVKTLALVTARPVIALTSLEILAGAEPERPLVAVVDARRGEVFQQRFGADGPAGPAEVGLPADLAPAGAGAVAVGDGADRYAALYGAGVRAGREPSAAVMVALAAGRWAVTGARVEPVYLRDPDVNVNVKTRHTPR